MRVVVFVVHCGVAALVWSAACSGGGLRGTGSRRCGRRLLRECRDCGKRDREREPSADHAGKTRTRDARHCTALSDKEGDYVMGPLSRRSVEFTEVCNTEAAEATEDCGRPRT